MLTTQVTRITTSMLLLVKNSVLRSATNQKAALVQVERFFIFFLPSSPMYHEINVFPKVVLHSLSNSGWVKSPLDHLSYTKAVELQHLNGNSLEFGGSNGLQQRCNLSFVFLLGQKRSNETPALNEDQGNKLPLLRGKLTMCLFSSVWLCDGVMWERTSLNQSRIAIATSALDSWLVVSLWFVFSVLWIGSKGIFVFEYVVFDSFWLCGRVHLSLVHQAWKPFEVFGQSVSRWLAYLSCCLYPSPEGRFLVHLWPAWTSNHHFWLIVLALEVRHFQVCYAGCATRNMIDGTRHVTSRFTISGKVMVLFKSTYSHFCFLEETHYMARRQWTPDHLINTYPMNIRHCFINSLHSSGMALK